DRHGHQHVATVDPKVEPDPERQRVDADRVLDDPIGGGGVQPAPLERRQVLLAQVGPMAQDLATLVDGELVETRKARAVMRAVVGHPYFSPPTVSTYYCPRRSPRAPVFILRIRSPRSAARVPNRWADCGSEKNATPTSPPPAPEGLAAPPTSWASAEAASNAGVTIGRSASRPSAPSAAWAAATAPSKAGASLDS